MTNKILKINGLPFIVMVVCIITPFLLVEFLSFPMWSILAGIGVGGGSGLGLIYAQSIFEESVGGKG